MGVPLSKSTRDRLLALFTEAEVEAAEQLIVSSCAENLPLIHDASPEGLERIRFAVLKLSDGDLDKLWNAVELAKTDWRDALVSAGFGYDVSAHEMWWPEP